MARESQTKEYAIVATFKSLKDDYSTKHFYLHTVNELPARVLHRSRFTWQNPEASYLEVTWMDFETCMKWFRMLCKNCYHVAMTVEVRDKVRLNGAE